MNQARRNVNAANRALEQAQRNRNMAYAQWVRHPSPMTWAAGIATFRHFEEVQADFNDIMQTYIRLLRQVLNEYGLSSRFHVGTTLSRINRNHVHRAIKAKKNERTFAGFHALKRKNLSKNVAEKIMKKVYGENNP
jgi:hypothetical protein